MAEIVYDDVSIFYNGSIVSNISFHVPEGAHTCILGQIGSGKTLLLQNLAGRSVVSKGSARYFDDGSQVDSYQFLKQTQFVEFSKPSRYFNPAHHFYQQRYHHQMEDDEFSKSITISGLLTKKGVPIDDQIIQETLQRAGLHDRMDTKLIQLSNGQRKKLQLIFALMQRSRIMLLDSPHLGLDEESRFDLNNWIYELADQNDLQIIMCTDERDIPDWISCRIELHYVRKRSSSVHQLDKLEQYRAKTAEPSKESVFEFENLNLSFERNFVFNDISWRIRPGERVALIGKNGSGKSTMFSFLYADNPRAYSTMLQMFGTQRGKGDNIWDVKRRIGFVSSELHIYFTERISCKKVIATGFFDTKFVSRKLSEKEEKTIDIFVHYFDADRLLDRNFQQISYGEQRLILLIRSLVKIPQVLLLDEPYQGFDLELIRQSNTLINYLTDQFNLTLIFISHYEEELPSCIERRMLLKDGKLLEV